MLYGKHNVSTRTMFKLTAMLLLVLVGGAGVGFAAGNTGAPPQLVPFQVNLLAGNPTNATNAIGSAVGGFAGEGLSAAGAAAKGVAVITNNPQVLVTDSVGNVYFADSSNAVIREINLTSGVVTTVVGVPPTGCSPTGGNCHIVTGCADGVPARSPILGNMQGLAIDAYSNLYFNDATTNTMSVVYRGGTQVANFIKLVNPAGVATSNGVVTPGYVYHVAGTITISNCQGTSSKAASTTGPAVPAGDGNLAYNSGATFGNIGSISLDSAGNIFVGDGGVNNTIRVINTQSVAQTFFGVKVQPGFIASFANCGALTQLCPPGAGNSPITVANTGIGGPPLGAVFNTLATGQGQWMTVDAYGNMFELNYKGATPNLYLATAFAGGPTLGNLINQADKLSNITNAPSLVATPGDFYILLQTLTLRPGSITEDAAGNLYYEDNHYGQIYRIDINSVAYATNYLGSAAMLYSTNQTNRNAPATPAVPAFCYGTGGGLAPAASGGNVTLTGQTTPDIYGDGCPAGYANGIGNPHASAGFGSVWADGPGNLYIANRSNDLIQDVVFNNRFPPTPLGSSTQQTLQIHFDQSNLPVKVVATAQPTLTTVSATPTTPAGIAVASGSTDFSINPIDTIWTTATGSGTVIGQTTITTSSLTGNVGNPICANTTGAVDTSIDCVVNVIFTPTAGGLRTSQLVVTTANGSVYNFGLSGIGTGGQLAIDGGAQTVAPFSGLGNPGQVAVDVNGTRYVADPANNRVVVLTVGGAQTTVGTGLKSPMGVAVDTSGNVFISDTGNNRVLKVSQATGVQTVIGQVLAVGSPAYPQYQFKGPQGLAVDLYDNVYVADTGNGVVVEIPSNIDLGGATPLQQFTGAVPLISPVSVALDSNGNIYVADSGNFQVVEIPAGGGDPQNLPLNPLPGFGIVAKSLGGVAVDGAGDVFVAGVDSTGASVVYEVGAATGPAGTQFQLGFTGLNFAGSAPAATSFAGGSLALDANGNLYLSDSGNSRVLFYNRQNPTVQFGTVAQNQPTVQTTLTVTNTGTINLPVSSSPASIISSSPAGNTAFNIIPTPAGSGAVPCASAVTLVPGGHCTFIATFLPTSDGLQSATVSITGTPQTITLNGNGEQPLAKIVLAVTSPVGTPTPGTAITVTATLTQPNIPNNTPGGIVTFTYTVNGANGGTASMPMLAPGPGGSSTASFTIPATAVLQGRLYVVNATYQGDGQNSQTVAAPLTVYVPGIPVTATAASATFVYGTAPKAITGTVVPDPTPVTYSFTTAATATTPIGTYPITVVFSGTNAANYGFPPVLTSANQPAVEVETAAPLAVKASSYPNYVYGSADLSYTSVVTGAVNGDKFAETYSPSNSSILDVGTYPLVPTVVGNATGNYTISVTNGSLVVNKAPSVISVSATAPSVLTTALSTDPIIIVVSTGVGGGKGTPSGTVTITDTFTPIIATAPGTGPTAAPVTIGPLPLVAGTVSYAPTSPVPGTHVYSVAYSGDKDFLCSSQLGPGYTACPSTAVTTTSLIVDNQDFTVTSTTNPVLIAPGVIPGGNSAVAGQASATPEQATITIASILSFTGTVTLSCVPQNPSYVTCTLSPPAVTVTAPASGSTTVSVLSIASISTPATLPLNFNFGTSQIRQSVSSTVLAFLPLGALAFCFRRRRRLSKALWMLLAIAVVTTGLNGCGSNSVHFFTPVPAGPQTVTVFATGTSPTTNTVVTRSFTIPINIQ